MIFHQGWGRGVARREESDPRFPMWVTEWMVFSPNKIENERGRRIWVGINDEEKEYFGFRHTKLEKL